MKIAIIGSGWSGLSCAYKLKELNPKNEITVFESAPVADIKNLVDGQYIPPGEPVNLDASSSYDFDNDIVVCLIDLKKLKKFESNKI